MTKIIKMTGADGIENHIPFDKIERWDYFGFSKVLTLTLKEKDPMIREFYKGVDADKIYNDWLKDSEIPGDSHKSSYERI